MYMFKKGVLPKVAPVWLSLALGTLWVTFIWDFWENGLSALGINITIFLLLVFVLSEYISGKHFIFKRAALIWSLPLLLSAISYSLFENPFIRLCNILFLPLALFLLCLRAASNDTDRLFQNPSALVFKLLFFSWYLPNSYLWNSIVKHLSAFSNILLPRAFAVQPEVRSILRGLIVFVVLALVVVVPLLSSADQTFSALFERFYRWDWFINLIHFIFDSQFWLKTLVALIISVTLLAALTSWLSPESTAQSVTVKAKCDPLTGATLIGGILVLYGIFIGLQIGHLWVSTLPTTFENTESYVKSGFWQLVILSGLNILLVGNYIREREKYLWWLLVGLALASILLLFSAAHRMFLYVTLYGLSHQKFYASYTVLFCIAAFVLIGLTLFRLIKVELAQSVALLLIWMFGLVTIFPTEYVIAKSNLALSQRADSRLELSELKMLSIDALPFVRHHRQEFVKEWTNVEHWISAQESSFKEKSGTAHTLMSLLGL